MSEYVTKFSAGLDPTGVDDRDDTPSAVLDTFPKAIDWLKWQAHECEEMLGEDADDTWEPLRAALADPGPGPAFKATAGGLDFWVVPTEVDKAWDDAVNEWLTARRAAAPQPTEPEPF